MTWYEVVTGDELMQCDLIPDVEVPVLAKSPLEIEEGDDSPFVLLRMNAMVLTQTCDLLQGKEGNVIVAPYHSWHEIIKQDQLTNGDKRRKEQAMIRKGARPHYSLLAEHDEGLIPYSVVDFRQLHTVEMTYLRQVAVAAGQRIRLLPPYREGVSHHFAQFFSRVAVPDEGVDFDNWNPPTAAEVMGGSG
jgi:hypothetical protein